MGNPVPPRSPNSAQPSKLAKPVPPDNQKAEVEAFLKAYKPPQTEASAEVEEAPAENMDSYAPVEVIPEEPNPIAEAGAPIEEAVRAGADYAGRGLDYAGGLTRTAIADVAQKSMGKTDVVTKEDYKKALKGQAAQSAEFLRRMGVPEGATLDLGKFGKVTQRGAEGLALDIATDPLTYVGSLAKEVPYIGKLMNAPGRASEALGEAAYRSAFSKMDEAAELKGAGKLSDVLLAEGAPVGGLAKIEKKVDDMRVVMGKLRQGLYDKASEKGVTIDTAHPLKNAEATLKAFRRDPGLRPAADQLQQLLDAYKGEGKVSLEQVSEWKTNLYNSLPDSAFDKMGRLKGPAKQFKGALASDFRQAIIDAGNKAEKGLGDSINAINDKYGSIFASEKALAKGAAGKGGNSIGEIVDKTLLASGHGYALAGKKALDLATSPYARTAVGKALMKAGQSGLADAAARRLIIDQTRAMPQGAPIIEIEEPTE